MKLNRAFLPAALFLVGVLLAIGFASARYAPPSFTSAPPAASRPPSLAPPDARAPQTRALNPAPPPRPAIGADQPAAPTGSPVPVVPLNARPASEYAPENSGQDPRRYARYRVTERLWNAWIAITGARSARGLKTPPCNLILLNADEQGKAYQRDMELLFPQGRAHLPATLLPRQYYCTTSDCDRRVQYFGKNYQDGYIFLVFRWAAKDENLLADAEWKEVQR